MVYATWLGVALLFFTLLLTLQANRAAVAGTKTAAEMVKLERAWPTPSQTTFVSFRNGIANGEPVQDGFMISSTFKNSGRTPASQVRFWMDFAVVQCGEAIPDFGIPKIETDAGAIVSIGEMFGKDAVMKDDGTKLFRIGAVGVIVFSGVTYRDGITGEIRSTKHTVRAHHRGGTIAVNGQQNEAIVVMQDGKLNHAN